MTSFQCAQGSGQSASTRLDGQVTMVAKEAASVPCGFRKVRGKRHSHALFRSARRIAWKSAGTEARRTVAAAVTTVCSGLLEIDSRHARTRGEVPGAADFSASP